MAAVEAVPPQQAAPAPAQPTQPQQSSLYVGDLDRDATEASLYDLFSQVGPVASIRVCRDAVTRRSLGYAYVNYNSALDPGAAERALETLNYTPINGKPIRIMWSHRDPAFRKSGVGNIFIKNLDKSIDNKALHDTFSQFGNILSCKVAQTPDGQSKGYGFVHFETEEAANLAIEKVNNMQLADKIVFVGKFLKRSDRGGGDHRFTNVYIKNLPEEVDDAGLKTIAEEFGEVTSAVVMMSPEGKSRGFGFVNFKEPESASKAVEVLNGTERDGKTLYAGRAQKKAEREAMLKQKFDELRQERMAKYAGMNLYIKNLADEVNDELLRSEFAAYGTITSAKVMSDDKGKSKGFGFVCYTSADEATKAVTEMNGKMVKGKPLYVALAQRKEVRRAQLQQQLNQQRLAMQAAGRGGPMPGMFPGAAPPMYFAGPGMQAGRGPMMYPGMMGPQGRMGPGGRGPRGGPMGPMGPGPMMMAGPMGPGAPMGGRMGGRGGRGGRGMGRGEFSMEGPVMVPLDGGRGRGFEGGRGAGRGRGRGPAGRGMAPPPPPAAAAPAAAPAAEPAPQPGNIVAQLANASPDQQKQMLGEQLFPLVSQLQPDLAGKITGMLLEMDNSEVLLLLDNKDELKEKVNEAIEVLRQHNAIPDSVAA